MADVVINGVHFNAELCKELGAKAFVSTMSEAFFLDKPKSERQAILKDAYKLIAGNTEDNQVETSDTVDAD